MSNMLRKSLSLVISATLIILSGCATTSPSGKYAKTQHILKKITKDDEGYFKEYKESVDNQNDPVKAQKYLDTGITLSRSTCQSHLNTLAANENDTQFLKEEFGVLVVLSTGIMGLNGVSQDSFSRLALGGAAVNSTIDLYRNHYLLGPDSETIIDMIKKAMVAAEQEIANRPPATFTQAFSLLESYSAICSDAGIRRLVKKSIEAASFVATAPIEDQLAEQYLTEIAMIFKRSGLSDNQYFGLYWLVSENPSNENYVTQINKALGDLNVDVTTKAILDNSEKRIEIKNMFNRVRKLVAAYKVSISEKKKIIDNASTPSDDQTGTLTLDLAQIDNILDDIPLPFGVLSSSVLYSNKCKIRIV